MNTFTLLRNKLRQNQAKSRLKYAFNSAKIYNARKSGQKEFRSYPKVHAVTFDDKKKRLQYVFTLPNGFDPKELFKREYVFRQIFGKNVELKGDDKKFVLTVYDRGMPTDIKYRYHDFAEEIKAHRLPIICGMNRNGEWVHFDFVSRPHLLVAGETGSGKSTQLRSVLTTLILSKKPSELELYLADCKRAEFHLFRGVEHVKCVVSDKKDILDMLQHVREEMDRRSKLVEVFKVTHVDDLPADHRPPYLIVGIDEIAMIRGNDLADDLMKDIGFMGRSNGIFLFASLQRPTNDCLDTTVRSQLTNKMGFHVGSKREASIVETTGADELETQGRFIMKSIGGLQEIQAPYLDAKKAEELLAPYMRPPGDTKSVIVTDPAPPGTPQIPEDTGAMTLDDLFNQHEGVDE